jgi:lipopolysaccharide export system permease protein
VTRRLTRYFLAAYLHPLLAGAGALTVLVMMADLMERLDKFITGKTDPRLVLEYLLALLPLRLIEIMPVAALLAALFSLGGLSHRKEVTAAVSGGIHPWRCVRPLVLAGVALSLLCLALGEYVTPGAARRASEIWNADVRHVDRDRPRQYSGITAVGHDGVFYSIGKLDIEEGWMEDVVLDWARDGRPVSQLQAQRAEWQGDRWTFRHGVERFFGPDGLTLARQAPFVFKEMRTRMSPKDLAPPEERTDALSYMALKRHVRRLKALGVPTRKLEVEMHLKLALPWANLIVLLLGIPFAFQKEGGRVKAVGFALGVAFFYFGLMQVGRALGQKPWCAPWLGAWMTNILFGLMGGWMFLRMRKLS